MSVFAGFSKTFNQNVWNIKGFQKKQKKNWVGPKFLASKSPLKTIHVFFVYWISSDLSDVKQNLDHLNVLYV